MSLHLTDDSKSRITIEDWFRNYRQYGNEFKELCILGFDMRQKSAEIRDIFNIETQYNKELVNEFLSDRYKEIEEWKDLIVNCIRDIKTELQRLKYEKDLCYRDLENLNPKFTVVNECYTLRSGRKQPDMCSDLVETELHKEYHLLETVKKDLSDKCEESFIHCTNVVELLGVLQTDVIHKEEACEIEKSTLEMKNNIANISRKPEINRCISYNSYESWLKNCKQLQSETLEELQKCIKLREEMCRSRQKAIIDILAQFDATNFALRKRMFETKYVLDELVWQKEMLLQEKERLSNEIDKLKAKLNSENETLKLFESQNTNRIYRVNAELCQDKCTENLEIQVLESKRKVDRLNNQIDSTIKTYNLLDQQVNSLEEEIKCKTCAFTIDIRCLEIRNESVSQTCI